VLKSLLAALETSLPTHPDKVRMLELAEMLQSYVWERERESVKPRPRFNLWGG
jgi:hypothetical protein